MERVPKKVEESKTQEAKKVVAPKTTTSVVKKVEESKQQEVSSLKCLDEAEFECQVCMTIMVEPVKLPCGHVFCAQCIQVFFVGKRECPMDRKKVPDTWKITVDKNLQQKIEKQEEKEFKARQTEIKK